MLFSVLNTDTDNSGPEQCRPTDSSYTVDCWLALGPGSPEEVTHNTHAQSQVQNKQGQNIQGFSRHFPSLSLPLAIFFWAAAKWTPDSSDGIQ